MKKLSIFYILLIVCLNTSMAQHKSSDKHRLIVTTDLGGTDPDDTQSMIHLFLCADRIDIEGLISSQVWMDDPDKTDKMAGVIDQYGEVLRRPNKHAAG